MDYFNAFWTGGLICALVQILLASGEKAQVTLEGLEPETPYFWYVQALF